MILPTLRRMQLIAAVSVALLAAGGPTFHPLVASADAGCREQHEHNTGHDCDHDPHASNESGGPAAALPQSSQSQTSPVDLGPIEPPEGIDQPLAAAVATCVPALKNGSAAVNPGCISLIAKGLIGVPVRIILPKQAE